MSLKESGEDGWDSASYNHKDTYKNQFYLKKLIFVNSYPYHCMTGAEQDKKGGLTYHNYSLLGAPR